MLKLLPALLLAIFAATIVFIVFRSRHKIGAALTGNSPNCPSGNRSTCCNAEMRPYGWTTDGWVALCKVCGNWQYLGEDHDNPPQGLAPVEPRYYFGETTPPKLRPLLPGERLVKGDHNVEIGFNGIFPQEFWDEIVRRTALGMLEQALGRPLTAEELSEVTSCPYCDAPLPGPHAYDCPRRIADEMAVPQSEMADDAREAARISHYFGDEGESLAVPPQPNLGGEGHLPYSGPRYADDELNQLPRHVPYDMLHNPIPGTGVFKGQDDD